LMEWITLLLIKLCVRKLDWVSEIDVQSSYFQEHLLLYMVPMHNGILFMTSQKPIYKSGIAYAQIWTNKSKAADKTTMLITELEWRMHLVQNYCESQLYLYARYGLVCYKLWRQNER
jgi:hypothetical protein